MGFDEDIRDELREAIATGEITILADGESFDKILDRRYPWSVGRLAWWELEKDKVRHVILDHENRDGQMLAFFATVQQEVGMAPDDPVVFTGDNLDHTTFGMTWSTLLKYASVLFAYPQHHYVWRPDGTWCLNHTMEDDLYFGYASDKPTPHSH